MTTTKKKGAAKTTKATKGETKAKRAKKPAEVEASLEVAPTATSAAVEAPALIAEPTLERERDREPQARPELVTLQGLACSYLAHLEESGKSASTRSVYAKDLELAVAYFGGSTEIGAISDRGVIEFEHSQTVTIAASGREKASPTIERTRRVLRLALTFAADRGWIAAAPYGWMNPA